MSYPKRIRTFILHDGRLVTIVIRKDVDQYSWAVFGGLLSSELCSTPKKAKKSATAYMKSLKARPTGSWRSNY